MTRCTSDHCRLNGCMSEANCPNHAPDESPPLCAHCGQREAHHQTGGHEFRFTAKHAQHILDAVYGEHPLPDEDLMPRVVSDEEFAVWTVHRADPAPDERARLSAEEREEIEYVLRSSAHLPARLTRRLLAALDAAEQREADERLAFRERLDTTIRGAEELSARLTAERDTARWWARAWKSGAKQNRHGFKVYERAYPLLVAKLRAAEAERDTLTATIARQRLEIADAYHERDVAVDDRKAAEDAHDRLIAVVEKANANAAHAIENFDRVVALCDEAKRYSAFVDGELTREQAANDRLRGELERITAAVDAYCAAALTDPSMAFVALAAAVDAARTP